MVMPPMTGSLVRYQWRLALNDSLIFAGYLFRATSGGIMRVAGLAPVTGIHGLENIDVTKLVNGHMAYRASMPRLLREVGWEVESDEFTEIEDPDPENHEKRQRELIREIDEARREAEFKPEKRRFGFFKRGKLAEKKGWETYDDRMKGEQPDKNSVDGGSSNVLFDIEAIRAELASEQIEVKQLESTLPPMKLNLNETLSSYEAEQNPRLCLRETKSYDGSMAFRPKISGDTSQTSLPNAQPLNPFDQGYDDNTRFDKSESPKRSIENTKMSFDNPQRSPSPAIKDHPQGLSLSDRSPSPLKQSQTLGTSLASQESFMTTPLTQGKGPNSMVTPTDLDMPNLERNAWLDEEDEEFGKEKEVTLSFA